MQSIGCFVGGGYVGVAVQIGGVGVGGAGVGGDHVGGAGVGGDHVGGDGVGASVGGENVAPTIHIISKLLSSKPLALKLMYISPPLLLLTRTLFPTFRYNELKEEWSAFMTNRSSIIDGLRTKVNDTVPG